MDRDIVRKLLVWPDRGYFQMLFLDGLEVFLAKYPNIISALSGIVTNAVCFIFGAGALFLWRKYKKHNLDALLTQEVDVSRQEAGEQYDTTYSGVANYLRVLMQKVI